MPSEDLIVNDPNYIIIIVLIAVFKVLKDPQLDACLILEPFFVTNYFDRDHLLLFVIEAF